jgi:hypothetical protein
MLYTGEGRGAIRTNVFENVLPSSEQRVIFAEREVL